MHVQDNLMININDEDEIILSEILLFCLERGSSKSCCPSEIARKIYPHHWRDKMERVRENAHRLVELDLIKITQGGYIVSKSHTGPIRLSLK